MFKKRNKIGSSLGERKSENRVLRLLRLDKGFATSLVGLEGKDQESVCEDYQKEIRNTMLEMEFRKAQALMAWQQNRQRFC
jgi:hypothetical protein